MRATAPKKFLALVLAFVLAVMPFQSYAAEQDAPVEQSRAAFDPMDVMPDLSVLKQVEVPGARTFDLQQSADLTLDTADADSGYKGRTGDPNRWRERIDRADVTPFSNESATRNRNLVGGINPAKTVGAEQDFIIVDDSVPDKKFYQLTR